MTTNLMKSLGYQAAKQADWRTSALKALRLGAKTPTRALGRYAGLGLAGEGAATGLTALTEGSKPFHDLGQGLRGWGEKYELDGPKPTKDIPASLGTLASGLTRPVKTIATALGGYGGEGSPLAYKGPTNTIVDTDNTRTRGPAGRDSTNTKTTTTRETADLSTKGRRKWDEATAIRALMSEQRGQLEDDYRYVSGSPRSTGGGQTFDQILDRQTSDMERMEEQRKSLEYGARGDKDSKGDPQTPRHSQLENQQYLKALMDELGSDRNVRLTPEYAGRSAAINQMLEGISGRGPQEQLGSPLSDHEMYRFPDSETRDRSGSLD
jgi:hypothetical protein